MYQNDCVGGWTSGGGGIPIEPPCCSWNGEEEIYEGMYDNDYEYSEQELKWIEEERREKEIEGKKQKKEKKKKDYEELFIVSLSMEVLILNIMAVFVMIGFAIIVVDGFPQDMRVGAVV